MNSLFNVTCQFPKTTNDAYTALNTYPRKSSAEQSFTQYVDIDECHESINICVHLRTYI